MGGFSDTTIWGLVWTVIAVAAGIGWAAAASTFLRRDPPEPDWFAGYDAMAGVIRD